MEPPLISSDESQGQALARYAALVRQYNERLGLVSSGAAAALEDQLIAPCLVFARLSLFMTPGLSIVDLGSGGGLPGIPLAIVWPGHKMLLVDSQQKKCDFLRRVVDELELPNVHVLQARVEKIRHLDPPDLFTARFFKDIRTIAAWTRHWRQPGTRYLIFSGAESAVEIQVYNLEFQSNHVLSEDKVALEYLTI